MLLCTVHVSYVLFWNDLWKLHVCVSISSIWNTDYIESDFALLRFACESYRLFNITKPESARSTAADYINSIYLQE